MKPPTFATIRVGIAVWLLALLALCTGLLFLGLGRELYYPDEQRVLLTAVAKVFAPHLAIVTGAALAATHGSTRRPSIQMTLTATLALLVWGAIVGVRVAMFVLTETAGDTVRELEQFLHDAPSAFGFLLAGILAFFFAKQE